MARWQEPEWLSLVALGSDGGQDLADGSQMSAGIHLRWDFENELGFPRGGFDIFRREHLHGKEWCAVFYPKQGGGIHLSGSDNGPQFVVSASGDAHFQGGCGEQRDTSIFLPGAQTLTIGFSQPMRSVEITLDPSSPAPISAEAFWYTGEGNVEVDQSRAHGAADGSWVVRLFADRIDFVTLSGTDLFVCQVCVVLLEDHLTSNWPDIPINGEPIFLPVTRDGWPGVHAHSPDDGTEAAARLPTALSAEVRDTYQNGFDDELQPMLYDLVGMRPQRHFYVDEAGSSANDAPAPSKLRWQALQLLRLSALDPNLARILGLYWQDATALAGQYYDYQLVGHWDNQPFPGAVYDVSNLTVGRRYATSLSLGDVQLYSPNPMTVIEETWDGSTITALQIEPLIAGAPITITLPSGTKSVTLRLKADSALTITAYKDGSRVEDRESQAGEDTITIEHPAGMTTLRIEVVTSITLIELVTRLQTGLMGDLHYVTFRQRVAAPPPVPESAVTTALVLPGTTSLTEDGTPLEGQTIGLRWELATTNGPYLLPDAPIFYRVRRAAGGNGENPRFVGAPTVLNPVSPTLLTRSITNGRSPYFLDRFLSDDWYGYQVQGIDLFGRLSGWGRRGTVCVADLVAPPAPSGVSAAYLDPNDPNLLAEDQSHAPGLKIEWEWSGFARLQAPDVVGGSGQFRIYLTLGDLNVLQGNVIDITEWRTFSELVTDVTWNGSANELVGEWIRIGSAYFEVTSNTTGANFILTVNHLTAPVQTPSPGSFSLVYSPNKAYWTDYREAAHWQRRLHVEPAVDVPIVSGQIVSVSSTDSDEILITTDQGLVDHEGVLTAGVLVSNGMIYRVTSHDTSPSLSLTTVSPEMPTDPPSNLQPTAGDAFVYYPGRRYQVYLDVPARFAGAISGTALAHIGVSTSDGRSYVADDPRWNESQHGALGNQPGNESGVSTPRKIIAVERTILPASANVPPAGATPIYAQPADYFGVALYTLNWSAVADANEYFVYRASGAALFNQDIKQRRDRKGFYATGDPFADDPGFEDWLAQAYPALTADTLTTEAWRDWAAYFYPTLTDPQLQALANRLGNEAAFRRVNSASITGTSYTDSLDGRGEGLMLYRVRAVNDAGVLGEWSDTYPPVHIYDVTPPAPPVVTSVVSGERSVTLNWCANAESDLAHYHLWRAESSDLLADLRRTAPTVVITPTAGAVIESYPDEDLLAGKPYYYRIAAVDTSGNVSEPSPVCAARPVDTAAPEPPTWRAARWNDDATAVLLRWILADETQETLIQRRTPGESGLWFSITSWLPSGTRIYSDIGATATDTNAYRLRVRSTSGNLNMDYNEIEVNPATGEAS